MLWTPFLIVATLCVQIYIIAAIFFLTYRIVTPRLNQIPTNLKRHDYINKRSIFITYIGFFEMIFVLIVQVELSRHVPLNAQPMVEKHCSEMRDDGAITFVSYGILACIILSVVRCLVQSYVLERLSMPDVVSMTRVYLLPSTYFVGLLCVRLWFNVDVERSNRIACYQTLNWANAVVKNSPVNFFLFMLTFMIINIIYEFAVSGCEKEPRLPAYGHIDSDLRRQMRSDMKQADTVTTYVAFEPFGQQSIGLQSTLINVNEKASHSSLVGTINSTIHVPTMDADPQTTSVVGVEPSYSKSVKSWRAVLLGDKFRFKLTRGSFRKFLTRSVRLHFALVVYFVIFVGCYQCTEYLLLGSFLEDFTPIVFSSIVIINGVLRVVQIAHAWTIITDEKSHDVVVCENQSVAALVEV